MVAQKFRVLLEREKLSVRGSAIDTLSDTKQRSPCREESKCEWRLGYATFEFVNFVRVYCICVYYHF